MEWMRMYSALMSEIVQCIVSQGGFAWIFSTYNLIVKRVNAAVWFFSDSLGGGGECPSVPLPSSRR